VKRVAPFPSDLSAAEPQREKEPWRPRIPGSKQGTENRG
jgi:hypothetical protein